MTRIAIIGTDRIAPAIPQIDVQATRLDQDHERAEVERASHQPRLDEVAERHLRHAHGQHEDEDWPDLAELQQRKQRSAAPRR